ncbi:MAG: hypothetical protein AAF919_09420 [Pseudomonadota bacterium]
MNLIAPRIVCVGTHHKTGTVWMRRVFRRLAEALGVATHVVYRNTDPGILPPRDRVILFSWSSAFPDWLLDRPDARILHLIRDPRDVLLSGMRYHRRASAEAEPDLHVARDDLDGRSYQQHLEHLPDDDARLSFEMGEHHARTLKEMCDWSYDRANTVEARYETLMRDTGGTAFRDHLRDLGLPEPEVETGAGIFWRHSLFGGLAETTRRDPALAGHVADGRVAQWRKALPSAIATRYAERHGNQLVSLGYENHPTAWLEEVRHAA